MACVAHVDRMWLFALHFDVSVEVGLHAAGVARSTVLGHKDRKLVVNSNCNPADIGIIRVLWVTIDTRVLNVGSGNAHADLEAERLRLEIDAGKARALRPDDNDGRGGGLLC